MYMEDFAKYLVIFVQRYFYPCWNKVGKNKDKTKQKQKQKQKKRKKEKNNQPIVAIFQKYNF